MIYVFIKRQLTLNVNKTLRIHNILFISALIITLCRLYAIVMNVLHFCFKLHALKMTSKIKHRRAPLFNEWDLTHFSHTEYASLFMLQLYMLSPQNAPSAQVNVSARHWKNFFCRSLQQFAETRQLNSKWTAFYYNSVLIIMLCIWQSES